MKQLNEDIEEILAAIAKVSAVGGQPLEVQVLASSSARIEETSYDNWDGGSMGLHSLH